MDSPRLSNFCSLTRRSMEKLLALYSIAGEMSTDRVLEVVRKIQNFRTSLMTSLNNSRRWPFQLYCPRTQDLGDIVGLIDDHVDAKSRVQAAANEIGRASCRERGCQYV